MVPKQFNDLIYRPSGHLWRKQRNKSMKFGCINSAGYLHTEQDAHKAYDDKYKEFCNEFKTV